MAVRVKSLQLVEGLLRCSLGERVIKWKWHDMKRRLDDVEEQLEQVSKKRMTLLDDENMRKMLMQEYYGNARSG
jgi:hypothetical protein